MVTIVLLKVASTWAMPECTFLLPFALTILTGSICSPVRERSSAGGGATGAASSLRGLAGFFATGFCEASAGGAAALTGSTVGASCAAAPPSLFFALSGFGFLASAI